MIIRMPTNLDLLDTINFCLQLDETSEEEKYVFDHKYLSTVEPFGMLLAGAKIRQFMNSREDAQFSDRNYRNQDYLAHMGFFQSVYQNYGNKPGQARGNNRYIPITEIIPEELEKEASLYQEHVGETIERHAGRLAKVLSQGDRNLKDYLTYSIRELIRNIVEHSEASSVWFAAQYWPTKDLVEIAILDEGIGIRRGLAGNRRLNISNDEDALLLSIEPGISGKFVGRQTQEDDIWANSGFGLFMTSSICQRGGNFVICSGEKVLFIDEEGFQILDSSFQGTAIRMQIEVSKIIKLSQLTSQLIRQGEKKAKINSKHRILSASKVSRMLTVEE